MIEQPAAVALELRDWIASARRAGNGVSSDILAGYTRLMDSQGSTVDDALAFIAYALVFLDTADTDGFPLKEKTVALIARALEALTTQTDTDPFDFIDFDKNLENNQEKS